MLSLLSNANVQWVLGGTLLLGVSSGLLGSFALLRRRSLMGDVLAHTALPGVAVAFMLTQTKSVLPLFVGAVIAGFVGTWCVDAITRNSRIKEDTAQGLVLTVFFGLGVVLLTQIAKQGGAAQSGLDRFLFGQAASLVGNDLILIGSIALVLTIAVVLFFKEFKLLCFDPGFGTGVGLPIRRLDQFLMFLVVCVVAIGLQTVGVVLMAALLITPAAAARYLSDRLPVMVFFSGVFGGLSGVLGTLISLTGRNMPTGPLIVLVATAIFVVCLLGAPQRGLIPNAWRRLRTQQRVADENLLRALYETIEVKTGLATAGENFADSDVVTTTVVTNEELVERLRWSPGKISRRMRRLARLGLVRLVGAGEMSVPAAQNNNRGETCALTSQGLARARKIVRTHRLWELFLAYEADFAVDHVDRDADDIEHYLPPSVILELEKRLKEHDRDSSLPPESVHEIR